MSLIRGLAAVENPTSLSNRMRSKRFRRFEELVEPLPRPLRIIDFGGTPEFWEQRGWGGRNDVHITAVNIQPRISFRPNFRPMIGDVADLSQFADNSFDIAFSNSVIEHLFTLERQAAMARELQRVAPVFWLQTPNYWFPIEPHFHVPGWQWLPIGVRKAVIRRRRCGWRGPCPDAELADQIVREVRLLTRSELQRLFPNAAIVPERFGGLVKSWIVHSTIEPALARRLAA